MSDDIAQLGFNVKTAGLTKGEKALKSYAKTGDKVEASIDANVSSMNSSFTSLSSVIGIASAAMTSLGMAKVLSTVTEFETSIAKLGAVSGAAADQMAGLEEQSRLLGATSRYSAVQAAEAQNFLAMAGFEVNEILSATPELLNLATAGSLDLASASDIASNVLGGMQMEVSELANVVDVMAMTASSSNTSIIQLGQALSYSAPLAAAAGVSIEEVAATIGSLSDAGVQATRAGTGVIAIMRQLLNPTNEGAAALASYGLSVDDVNIASLGLTKVLSNLGDASITTADAIAIFGSEGATAALIAASSAGKISSLSSELAGAGGAAKEMSDIMSDTTAVAAKGLASAVTELALSFGEDSGLNGELKDTIELATGVISAFNGMLPEFMEANDLTSEFESSVMSLIDAGESFTTVIGIGVAGALAKSTAATIAQVSADAAAVTSANAAGVARATLAKKAAAAATAMAVSEVEIAEARIASVTSSVAALDAETALEAERMRAQITSTGQVQSATRLAEIRTAQLAMTKQLTAAEIQLSAANSKAATTEAALATATTGVATAQRAATSTTLALRSATSFLLGPWGLLITAVGIAATTFISTKSESDSLEESLRNQKSAVNELITEYEKMSNAAMGSAYISAQKTLIELDQQRLDINKKINETAAAGGEGSYGVILSLKAQLEDLDTASIGAEQRLEAIQEIFNNGIEAISWSEPVEAVAESVADLTSQISSLSYEVSKSPYQAWLEEITDASTLTQIENLKDEIEAVWMAAQYGDIDQDDALDYIDQLKDKLESLQGTAEDVDLLGNASDSINAGISSLQSMASTGSTAYATLSAASDAYAAYQAINAVLTQGEGDPYTAFARMAAMAATVSSLGQSISGITGGSDSSYDSDTIQSEQGTDAYGDDYTSIVDSVEDTADATEDLVGINTDMLDALEDLTDSLTDAASISADSILDASIDIGSTVSSISSVATSLFDGVDSLFSTLTFGLTDGWISDIGSSIFGGDTSSVDEGVKIIGGTLSDLIEESAVYAYETIKTSGGWFSSDDYDTYSTYAEEASDQFSLVFASLYDSVYEAGSLLGMSDDYLSSVLSDYVIDTFSVSLDGLDDDEAAEELEAVFSEIFNDLAEEVIPWISDFQDAGEELATTLTRLAVEVSLLEYASDTLGFSLGDLADDAYDLTSSADALADYFDSTEDLSDAISSFISDFADDSTLLDLYGSAMTDALDEVGLSLPTSSDGFWDLMESLDASTDSGLEQIATLLELTDTASEYYDLLEDTQSEMADLSDTFAGAVADIYDVTDATEQMSLDAALAAAQLGDFSLAEALDVSDYTLDTDDYSSLADYNIAQAEVANKLMEIAELSAAEAGDVETEQLDELKAINESIITSITETNALLSANYKIAMESNEYLDVINNKTEYAA